MSTLEFEAEVQAERELSESLGDYVGKWVAVRDHKVISAADTPSELLETVVGKEVDGVYQVLDEQTAACFF